MRFVLGVLCTLAVALPAEAKGTLLRYAPEKGRTYRYVQTLDQRTDLSMGTMGEQQSSSKTTLEFRQTVTGRTKGGNVVSKIVCERVSMEIDSGGRKLAFDSTAPGERDANPLAAVETVLVGRTLEITTSPLAEVLEVAGLEDLWADSAEAEDPLTAQITESLEDSFGPDAIRALLLTGVAIYPAERVAVGESWSRPVRLDGTPLGGLRVEMDQTLVGTSGDGTAARADIDIASTIALEGGSRMIERMRGIFRQQGMDVEIDYVLKSGSGTGRVAVDLASGLVSDSTMHQILTFDITLEMLGQAMDMTMTVHQTYTLKRVPS